MYSAASSGGGDSMRQKAMDVNRSLRTIKNELETLLERGAIDNDAFDNLHALLPQEWSLRDGPPRTAAAATARTATPVAAAAAVEPTPASAPATEPATPAAEPPTDTPSNEPPTLGYATAKYRYDAPNDGDLAFNRGDAVAVHSRVNNDWWLGRNTRTGQEGIFPRQYIQPDAALEALEREGRLPGPEEAAAAAAASANASTSRGQSQEQYQSPSGPPPSYDQSYYGNNNNNNDNKSYPPQQQQPYGQPGPYGQPAAPYGQPTYAAPSQPMYGQSYGGPVQGGPADQQQQQQGQGQGEDKVSKHGKKIGGKLGNAFVTGVGFAAGAELVNSIF